MSRLALALLCLLLPLAGCSGARAAGPPAPQWGPDADTLGSPSTFMDAPIDHPAQYSPQMPQAVVSRDVAPAPLRQPEAARATAPGAGGLPAPRIRRRDGSVVVPPVAPGPQPAYAAQSPQTTPSGTVAPTAGSTGAATGSTAFTFRLQVGDELSMSVWKEKELTTKQRIIPGGTFAPPLLGTVRAAGLTLDELRDDLTRRYRAYLKEPKVSVNVEGIYSDRVFVLGEVDDAQAVDLHGPTGVVQSIAMAGGFKEETAEKRTVHLIRRGRRGQPLVYNVNVCAVLAGRVCDPPLQRGDIVFVPARGVTKWARTVGQALAPISTGLVSAGAIAGTVAIFSGNN